jgi:hypothetical protein
MNKKIKKLRLELKWNKKIQDFEIIYPLGVNTKNDSFILRDAINFDKIREMHSRGYNFETLKVCLDVDEAHPHFAALFPTAAKSRLG